MSKVKTFLYSLPATLLIATSVAVPVYARGGDDAGASSSNATKPATTPPPVGTSGRDPNKPKSADDPATHVENETEHPAGSEAEHAAETELHDRGSKLLKEAQDKVKTPKTADEKKKTCEERKTGLQNKVDNLVKNAGAHKTRIDGVMDKAVAYKTDNNITVANWDTLLAAATSAKAKAATSVTALTSLKPAVDCTSGAVASDVATFKAAATQARTDLQAYKTSVKALLTALEAAKEGANQ